MTSAFPTLKSLVAYSLEAAFNRYIQLDSDISSKLVPLSGKVIALHVTTINETLFLAPGSASLQILSDLPKPADAQISGSAFALGLMGLSATPMRALFNGEVRIEGDAQVARQFQRLLAELDINLEQHLARYTTPGFAQQISHSLRGSRDWLKHSTSSLRWNLQEFLQEETRDLPAQAEAEQLFAQIDACRSDFDRLQARIARLTPPTSNQD